MLFNRFLNLILGCVLFLSVGILGCSSTANHDIFSVLKKSDQDLGGREKAYSYFCAGYLFMLNGDWEKAVKSLEEAYRYDRSSERITRHLATCYFRLGDNEKAIGFVEKLSEMNPQEFNVHYTLATLYENSGRNKEAVAEYERAVMCKTTKLDTVFLADSLYRLANLYMQEGKMEKGTDCYESLLVRKLVSEPAKIYYELGQRYFEKSDIKKALGYFLKAKDADKKLNMVDFSLVLCYEALGDYENAIKEADVFLEKDADNWVMHLALSEIYGKMKHEQKRRLEIVKTQEILKKNIARGSDNPKEYFMLSQIYMSQQKMDDAIAVAENLKLIPMDKETGREAYFLLANLYYESQKFDKAEEALQMTLKINPDFSEANNFLGYLYVEHNKNLDKAIELIQKALKAEPKNGAYLDSLGWAYYKKVQLEGRNDYLFKALQKLLEAVRYLEEPDIYEHIGDVQYSIGNWDEAVKSLEKAESLYTKMQDGEKQKEKVAVKLKNIKRLILMEKTDSKVIANHIEVGNGIQP